MLLVVLFQSWFAPYVRARLGRTNRGASLVEYVLLLMLIALVCLASVMWFGESNRDSVNETGSTITSV